MGSVIPLKKSANSAYLDLKNLLDNKLKSVEKLIHLKLKNNIGLINKMSNYHLGSGGKRIRALLTMGAAKLGGYVGDSRDVNLAACVELIHSATLLHDDVVDESKIRRGIKTTNSMWGNQSSILVGDYLLSRCFEIMVEDGNLEILKLLSSTSTEIAQGEVLQLQHKGEIDILEETYFKITSSKTAALFSAATKVGAILGKKEAKYKEALEFYGKNIGITFQIADDALDYSSNLKSFGKEIGNDFFEGKVTLPIILLYQKISDSEKTILKNLFFKKKRDKEELNYVLNLIKKNNIIKDCYKKADHFINLASNALSVFEDSKEKKILKNLTTFSIERNF